MPHRGHDTAFRPRRELYYDGQSPYYGPDSNVDRIGEYVARRLVPAMLSRSDRPLQLVMNFGHLEMEESPPVHSNGRPSSSRNSSNAIIYNAPGSTLAIGDSEVRRARAEGGRYLLLGSSDETWAGSAVVDRRIGTCCYCLKRQLVGPAGYCRDCYTLSRSRGRLLPRADSIAGRGWDGIRYVNNDEPRPWGRRLGDREPHPYARSRLQGYYSDSDSARWN